VISNLDDWLRDLTEGLARNPLARYQFRCHPDVYIAIREAAAVQPLTPHTGVVMYGSPAFGSADVIVLPELGPGGWELYGDGELLKSGRLGGAGVVDVR
jgi:hypothetical protein